MTWLYWGLLALAVLIVAGVPLAYWLEDRAERRDREAWRRYQQGQR